MHGDAMQGSQDAPFGPMAVSHYAAGVGDLGLGHCAVFKALDIIPSSGYGSNRLSFWRSLV
jgi:hypothetical protein